jgi:hypothetical protein
VVRILAVTGVVVAFVLTGCADVQSVTDSKTVICGKALGTIALSAAANDARSRLDEAQHAADVLSSLANQTQDSSLAGELRSAAQAATDGAGRNFDPAGLAAWVRKEQAQFDALRRVCS